VAGFQALRLPLLLEGEEEERRGAGIREAQNAGEKMGR
jgi:hypothetical protein